MKKLKSESLVGCKRKPDTITISNTVNKLSVLKEIEIAIVIASYNLSTERMKRLNLQKMLKFESLAGRNRKPNTVSSGGKNNKQQAGYNTNPNRKYIQHLFRFLTRIRIKATNHVLVPQRHSNKDKH